MQLRQQVEIVSCGWMRMRTGEDAGEDADKKGEEGCRVTILMKTQVKMQQKGQVRRQVTVQVRM